MDKWVKTIFNDFKKLLTPVGKHVFENKNVLFAVHFNHGLEPEETTRRHIIEKVLNLMEGLEICPEKTNPDKFKKRKTTTDYLLILTANLPKGNNVKVLLEAKSINTDLFANKGAVKQIIKALSLSVNKKYKFGVATDGNAWVFIDKTGNVAETLYIAEKFEQIQKYLENKEQLPNTSPDPKISEYQLDTFKKQYKTYFPSILQTLKDTHKEVFIKGRTCQPVKWEEDKSRFIKDDKGQQTYSMEEILTDKSHKTPIAIIGAMGAGKSVYVYQLMEMFHSRFQDTLIFFGEFTQWKEEVEKTDLIETFSNFTLQTLKHLISNTEINKIDDEFKNALEEYIRKKNAILFIDGLDEFTEDTINIGKLIETLQYNHQVIITGRDYSIRTFQASFSNKRNDRLKILRLNDFTDGQVQKFLLEFSQRENIETKIEIYLLRKWAPAGGIYPELNYRNPLVLKAILRNPPESEEKLSGYLILEKIATGTFEWFIGKKHNEPDFRFTWNHLNNLDPDEIKICFFKVHQKIAIAMLNQNRNLKNIDTTEIFDKANSKIKKMITAITLEERNTGFIQKYEQSYQFKPDRMFDFFITSEIKGLLSKKNQLVKQILTKIIENTGLFRNTTKLLLESMTKTENVIFTKYSSEIIKSNKNLRILKEPWYKEPIQTKNGKLTKFYFHHEKPPTIINLLSHLPFGLGKRIKGPFFFRFLNKLSELQELDLSLNQLSSLPVSIFSLEKLQVLSVRDNQLSSLPESISKLQNLRELRLYNNQLSSLPESISKLQNLQDLFLQNNQLSSLPESITSLHKLQWLNLGENKLPSLPKNLGSLKNLQELYLQNNQLSSLPESISKLQNLHILHLNGNQLSSLPQSITSLQKLQVLHLNGNQLSSLPESISSLKNLQELYLQNTQLSSLPESISKLQELFILRLDGNQLSSLPESISKLKNLQTLYLDCKQLSSLPKSSKNALEKLRKNECEIVEW